MAVRNKRPDLNGVLLIDKPLHWTSADVVRKVRAASGGAKVGHAGTLDPLATGLLVLCLGRATKAIDRIMGGAKRYETTIDLSAFTATDDAEGGRELVEVLEPPTEVRIRGILSERMEGVVEQSPPAFSAIKVDGRRAYDLARAGRPQALAPRPVVIHGITITGYEWPLLDLEIHCGKGTYIRSIARDLGNALSTGGTLTMLRRTVVEPFELGAAMVVEDLPGRAEGFTGELLLDPPTSAESARS
jgi:tRNA pseudouridine55 synthase